MAAKTTKKLKLARATANLLTDKNQAGTVFGGTADYMELPTKYRDLIKMCRFFYNHDPTAGTVMNNMVDFTVSPIINQKAF